MIASMVDTAVWIKAIRASHDHFVALVAPLDDQAVQGPSYASDWTIAQVASHLGSQAEIFGMFLDAGLSGTDAPGSELFGPVWDRWNNLPPAEQVADSVRVNEEFVTRVEGLSESERAGFALSMFGMDLDLSGMAAMRLGEHALHTWDIAVALDPKATVAPNAVELLIDTLPGTAARAGQPAVEARTLGIETVAPQRSFVLTTGPDVALAIGTGTEPTVLRLPAEAFVRLVSGRLDPDHTPAEIEQTDVLAELRPVFPGF
jgi:uncharacterized protein (TIGR03083 family)